MAKGPKRPAKSKRVPPQRTDKRTDADARRDAFVQAFMASPEDPTGAALKAGFSPNGIHTAVQRLLANVHVRAKIDAFRAEQAKRTEITSDKLLKRLWDIVCADPNDIVQNRRDNCRHCWGVGHAYQWTEAEYDRAAAEARLAAQRNAPSKRRGRRRIIEDDENDDALFEGMVRLPDDSGGFGFIGTREPNEECPECFGLGVETVYVADTRRLKGPAKLLYAGMQKTKDGIKPMLHNQMDAAEKIARHIGFYEKDKAPEVAPVINNTIHVAGDIKIVREELGSIYGALIEGDVAPDHAGGDQVLRSLLDDSGE